ncbi:MAG: AAA family ATPase [Chloroflexi bacterium]|nr:AAA family ATPase [Chloroflexota bacterium]
MSAVFLTGTYAYKVKKPVNLGYLDYSTLEQRLRFCKSELQLNRRLCPEAYLEVGSIRRTSSGLCLSGEGEIVEYAVKMRQLPLDRMMDRLLDMGQVTSEMVCLVARKIASFHATAATSEYINSFGELCSIRMNVDENFSQTETSVGKAISQAQYEKIKRYSDLFLKSHAGLVHVRIDQGRIRDCHGDLHTAHVCFSGPDVCIYDCIEFNDRFRYSDVASEVAFLSMDLDKHGRHDLAQVFEDAYQEMSGDLSLKRVLPFYKCYRAYVRGKVETFKLADCYLNEKERSNALDNARRYFDLAAAYASRRPVLVLMAGLVGTGKTTVARTLQDMLGGVVVSSDVVRKQLAGIPETDHRHRGDGEGIYTPAFSKKTYETLFRKAEDLLASGQSVMLDATFGYKADRLRAKKLADSLGARFLAVECVLPEEEARRRIEDRLGEVSASDADWNVYLKMKPNFQEVTEFHALEHVIIDTSKNWDDALKRIVEMTE